MWSVTLPLQTVQVGTGERGGQCENCHSPGHPFTLGGIREVTLNMLVGGIGAAHLISKTNCYHLTSTVKKLLIIHSTQ